MGQPIFAPERRVFGVADRRATLSGGGRRAEDHDALEFSAIIPCLACDDASASLRSVAREGWRLVATYVCPRCGHREKRVGDA